jgi:multiple antibiotic resistance protein
MSDAELLAAAFTSLLIAIGPVEAALVFGSLTGGVHRRDRFKIARQAIVLAAALLLGFAFFGTTLLRALNVSLDAFRVAGGILLLLQAIELIYGRTAGLSSLNPDEQREARQADGLVVFPLAFPVISGPAAMTAAVLLMADAGPSSVRIGIVVAAIGANLTLAYLCMLSTDLLHRVLKTAGSDMIARIGGVVLAAVAVQFVFDGIRSAELFRLGTS